MGRTAIMSAASSSAPNLMHMLFLCMSFGGAQQVACEQCDKQGYISGCQVQQVLYFRAGHGRTAGCTETKSVQLPCA